MVGGIDLKLTCALKYFYLCSRCTAGYTLVYMRARMTIRGARNVRCTIVYAKMLLGARVPRFLITEVLQVLFLYIFPSSHMNLRDQPWRCRYFGAELTFCNCKLFAKVFLMLGNPFPVPFLCKLNHISVCFIRLARRSRTKSLFPSGKAMLFFKSIPGVLGRSVNFNIT